MAFKKKLADDEINQIAATTGFKKELILKDYYITIILYLMKDIKGIYFKGGTALQKTILDYSRISEDIDLTIEMPLNDVRHEIEKRIMKSKIFGEISQDKDVSGFVRLIIPYKSELGNDQIFIDINARGKLILKPETLEMKHFYQNIPVFKFPCLNRKEMIGEKVAAAIGRNKPRDHYDIYKIIKHNIPIDMKIVKAKCKKSGNDPSIIKMFNRAKKLYKRWNEDMIPLIKEEITFSEVMRTLADHFNLKVEKDKLKEIT